MRKYDREASERTRADMEAVLVGLSSKAETLMDIKKEWESVVATYELATSEPSEKWRNTLGGLLEEYAAEQERRFREVAWNKEEL